MSTEVTLVDTIRLMDPTPGPWKVAVTGSVTRIKYLGVATEDGKLLAIRTKGEPLRTEVAIENGEVTRVEHGGWPSIIDLKCMAYAPAMMRILESCLTRLPPKERMEATSIIDRIRVCFVWDEDTVRVKDAPEHEPYNAA